jgi:hypothetical protein
LRGVPWNADCNDLGAGGGILHGAGVSFAFSGGEQLLYFWVGGVANAESDVMPFPGPSPSLGGANRFAPRGAVCLTNGCS